VFWCGPRCSVRWCSAPERSPIHPSCRPFWSLGHLENSGSGSRARVPQSTPNSFDSSVRGAPRRRCAAFPGYRSSQREEAAIVANIGIRGLSSADYKTLILEDGVPVAPGLFVGNGRYHNPRIERIDGIEVLRGAGSLRYDPSTLGGVINYLTKNPERGLRTDLHAGSFNTRRWGIELGTGSPSDDSSLGVVLNNIESDGFMGKGFSMRDVMLKAGIAPDGTQRLALKHTDYRNDANISYRG